MTASLQATVKGGFFAQYNTTLAGISALDDSSLRKKAMFFLTRRGGLGLKKLMNTLNGVAAGSTATRTIGRVEANSELGGKRTVELQTIISRATTATDVSNIAAVVIGAVPYTVAADVIANGDGNPLGYR